MEILQQQEKVEIKDESDAVGFDYCAYLPRLIKSESSLNSHCNSHNLGLVKEETHVLFPEHEDNDELKDIVKVDVDADGAHAPSSSSVSGETFENHSWTHIKIEIDDSKEWQYNTQGSPIVKSENVAIEQNLRMGNYSPEILTLTEPDLLNKDGRVCHILHFEYKTRPTHLDRDPVEDNSLPCSTYGKLSETNEDMATHNSLSLHPCQACGIKVHGSDSLKPHVCQKESYPCPICGKVFTFKANMSRHKTVHSVKKPHVCEFCGKAFTRRGYLSGHLHVHTGGPERRVIGPKNYICDVCGRDFTQPHLLRNHQQTHSQDRSFVCSQCQKNFKSAKDLKMHLRCHGERSYECVQCGASFHRRESLTKHQRKHTGQRPFSCPHCSKTFTQKYSLDRHVKRHLR